jgi:hypothetical protein
VIAEALADYAKGTARRFAVDRAQTVGASECGQCARKTYWIKNEGDPKYGAERDPDYVDRWGARTRGSVFEDHFFVPALRAKYGDNLLLAGAQQRTFVAEFLSATPDGMLINQPCDALAHLGVPDIGEDGCFVIECKTADPRSPLEKARSENVFQAQVQLGLIREQTEHRPQYAVIIYADASFWNEIREFVVTFDEKVFANAKVRARQIMTALSADELLPEGWIAGGRECQWCPFTKACGRQRSDVPRPTDIPPDPQFLAEIADLGRAVKEQEAASEAADARLREMQHDLKARLRAKHINKIAGHGIAVTWSPVKGRVSWDSKGIREAAAAAGVDLSKYEVVGEQTDRLVIRVTAAP